MTDGPEQPAPWNAVRTRGRIEPWSAVTAVVLAALAVGTTYGVALVRGHAAAACDMLERGGGAVLSFFFLLLLGVNLALATGLWTLLRKQGGLGAAGALVVGTVLLAVTSFVFLALTGVPEGYPTPPGSCPGGRPLWWPSILPR